MKYNKEIDFNFGPDANEHYRYMLQQVFDGEYDFFPMADRHDVKLIADCGGNIGAFAVWASNAFPDAVILSYEPDPTCCELFEENIKAQGLEERVNLCRVALTTRDVKETTLYLGVNNSGENSLQQELVGPNTNSITVPTLHPDNIPAVDFMKLDIEGLEYEVLASYLKRFKPMFITFEAHGEGERVRLNQLMWDTGYVHCGTKTIFPGINVCGYCLDGTELFVKSGQRYRIYQNGFVLSKSPTIKVTL